MTPASRSAFVTGASGFVGSHLVRRLLEDGWRVRALRHREPIAVDGVEPVDGELSDVAAFASYLAGIDTVFHGAALLDPVPDAALAETVNRRATLELATAARDAGAQCFVFVSSMAAIGFHPGAGLLTPDTACRPTTVYGRTKRDAELDLLRLQAPEMRVVLARPPTVYGPGEDRNFLALTRAVNTGLFPIPGPGDNRMSFCHVANLVDALVWAAEHGASGVLHVADERPVTFREVVGAIAAALGRRPFPVPFPMPLARAVAAACAFAWRPLPGTPPLSPERLVTLTSDCALDTSELLSRGWRPPLDFESGVQQTVEWYRSRGMLGRG